MKWHGGWKAWPGRGMWWGRYGGEEFLLLLEGCAGEQVSRRAEAVCAAMRNLGVATSAGALPVTVSAGAMGAQGVDQVLQEVDLLLYRAKRGGRDCAVVGMAAELAVAA